MEEVTSAAVNSVIRAANIAPISDSINSGLTTLIPIGIGIMATFIGISLIKRVIYTFL